VELGNADLANRLREAFDIARRFNLDLATTVVPVVALDLSDAAGAGSSTSERDWIAGVGNAVAASVGYRSYAQISNIGAGTVVIDWVSLWAAAEVFGHLMGASLTGLAHGGAALSTVTALAHRRDGGEAVGFTQVRYAMSQIADVPTPPLNNMSNGAMVLPALGAVSRSDIFLGVTLYPGQHYALITTGTEALRATFLGREIDA
jgi:hypothetical protein